MKDDIYKKVMGILIYNLSEQDMVDLSERMDGDPDNGLLDLLNRWLQKNRPEVFE